MNMPTKEEVENAILKLLLEAMMAAFDSLKAEHEDLQKDYKDLAGDHAELYKMYLNIQLGM
jgi:hypothetical protein